MLESQVIYDPDPNPKNEEQAIARSHRIGQTRQVGSSPPVLPGPVQSPGAEQCCRLSSILVDCDAWKLPTGGAGSSVVKFRSWHSEPAGIHS